MFNCGICTKTTLPGEPATRVIWQKRSKVYPKREKIHVKIVEGKREFVDDPGGIGFEPAVEILVCRKCNNDLQTNPA